MDRLISEQAVIESIEFFQMNPQHFDFVNLIDDIKEIPSADPKWIPVSEYGYPKPEDEYKYFLTIDNKGEITIQEFFLSLDEEPQPYFSGMRNIIAWMPLPKPYLPDINIGNMSENPTGSESEDKCKNCEYYRNPDYTRCHKCKAESEG